MARLGSAKAPTAVRIRTMPLRLSEKAAFFIFRKNKVKKSHDAYGGCLERQPFFIFRKNKVNVSYDA